MDWTDHVEHREKQLLVELEHVEEQTALLRFWSLQQLAKESGKSVLAYLLWDTDVETI